MADVTLESTEEVIQLVSVSGASTSDITSAVNAHSALTTGVHGVGASTVDSAADRNTAIAAHNALATAHGLTANISAALTASASPSAGNPFATLSAARSNSIGWSALLGHAETVQRIRPQNLIALWPFWESSGTTILDYSGYGNNGSLLTGATLGATGIGDGKTAINVPGAGGVNLYSAGLAALFNSAEGTARILFTMTAAGWASASLTCMLTLLADGNNFVAVQKTAANRLAISYKAGGTTSAVSIITTIDNMTAPLGYLDLIVTWSKSNDRMRVYLNSTQAGTTQTGLGTWSGAIAATGAVAGCFSSSADFSHTGKLQYVSLWNVELTPLEVSLLKPTYTQWVAFGDSITLGTGATAARNAYINLLAANAGYGSSRINSGVSNSTLQNTVQNSVAVIGGAATDNGRDNYASKVTAYNPLKVVVLYGLNDLRLNDAAYTSALFQSDLDEAIAAIIAAGVTPQNITIGSPPYIPLASYALFSPYNGGSRVKHAAYTAACAAVATSRGTKYSDVYQYMTDNGGDTLISVDGVHPNDAGHAAIATSLLAAA